MNIARRAVHAVASFMAPPPDAEPGGLSPTEKARSGAMYAVCLTSFVGLLYGVQAGVAFAMNHKSFESVPFVWQCVAAAIASMVPYLLDVCRRTKDGYSHDGLQRPEEDDSSGD